jgi:nicotinamidase-related amidase
MYIPAGGNSALLRHAAAGGSLGIMGKSALIVIDMINTYDHKDAELLVPSAESVVPVVADLLDRARGNDVTVIYVNDNFGEWRSHHGELLQEALSGPHAHLVEPLKPDDSSLFVVKARHSIFFETPLGYLLQQQGIDHLVLCGQVTEQCVLYSCLDAHIRHFDVTVPRDAVARIHPDLADAALRMMERNMGARVCDSGDLWQPSQEGPWS